MTHTYKLNTPTLKPNKGPAGCAAAPPGGAAAPAPSHCNRQQQQQQQRLSWLHRDWLSSVFTAIIRHAQRHTTCRQHGKWITVLRVLMTVYFYVCSRWAAGLSVALLNNIHVWLWRCNKRQSSRAGVRVTWMPMPGGVIWSDKGSGCDLIQHTQQAADKAGLWPELLGPVQLWRACHITRYWGTKCAIYSQRGRRGTRLLLKCHPELVDASQPHIGGISQYYIATADTSSTHRVAVHFIDCLKSTSTQLLWRLCFT